MEEIGELPEVEEIDDEEQGEYTQDPQKLAEFWEKEVTAATKWLRKFHENGRKIEKIYLSQEAQVAGEAGDSGTHFNLFWSNIQVIMAASYARLPTVDVSRKFKDYEDDVSRVAGIMMQRILNSDTFTSANNTDETFRNALLDRYVPGLGQVWCRYEFEEIQKQDPMTGQTYPEIGKESAPMDHVRWEDFVYSPCRTWNECRWVSRKRYMSKKQLDEKFGEKIAEQVALDVKSAQKGEYDDPQKASPYDQGTVYEIWCKTTKRLYWYAKGCPVILGYEDDPLGLDDFFPCPRPMLGTALTNNFIARPEYVIVQSQYQELEMITKRCTLLAEAVRVVGAYDKEAGVLTQMLTNTSMNTLIPVDNWAFFAEKGGIKGAIDWLPLEMVVAALEKLTARKRELVQEVYEVLGISDLMRGATKASETATAQKLKAQFGGARTDLNEKNIAKFMSSVFQIRAEIICKHWQPQSIVEQSQIMMTADKELVGPAVQLLKEMGMKNSKLEVLSENIAAPDWEAEKQQRTEFLQAVSQFIGMSMPLIQAEPSSVPFLVQIIQWAAAGFQSGKSLEGVLDKALQALEQSISAPKPPPVPTPEDKKDLAAADKSIAEADYKRWEMGMPPVGHMMANQWPKPGDPPDQPKGGPKGPPPGGMPPSAMPPGGPQGGPPMPPRGPQVPPTVQ